MDNVALLLNASSYHLMIENVHIGGDGRNGRDHGQQALAEENIFLTAGTATRFDAGL
jgi:hypothetical protein